MLRTILAGVGLVAAVLAVAAPTVLGLGAVALLAIGLGAVAVALLI